MALVGVCFSIAFTFGPAIGAGLATITTVAANPFATAAGWSVLLIVTETAYLYFCLPETHPRLTKLVGTPASAAAGEATDRPAAKQEVSGDRRHSTEHDSPDTPQSRRQHTNKPALLNLTHFLFLLPFSGIEFSLPFVTAAIYSSISNTTASPSALNGRLLSVMGLIASLLQGTIVRRLPPLTTVKIGGLGDTDRKCTTERG